MEEKFQSSRHIGRTALSIVLILCVFGAVVSALTFWLRDDLRRGAFSQEVEMQRRLAQFEIGRSWSDDHIVDFDDESRLKFALIETAIMDGTLSLTVFDSLGDPIFGIPHGSGDVALSAGDWQTLSEGGSVSRLIESSQYAQVFGLEDVSGLPPILELVFPVYYGVGDQGEGFARYTLDGTRMKAALAKVDEGLVRQSLLAFGTGAAIICLIVSLFTRNLRKAYSEINRRTERLAAANAEIELAAKTSAIGGIATHLVHELKNPLAGLSQHVASSGRGLDDEDWQEARSAASRMKTMIADVVSVLKEEGSFSRYDLKVNEVLEVLDDRFAPIAKKSNIVFRAKALSEAALPSRIANLSLLILSNLSQNAIDAIGESGLVQVEGWVDDGHCNFSVSDSGCGIDKEKIGGLFQPGNSSKPNGTGIGLSISHQLARNIGGEIVLDRTTQEGTMFVLKIPLQNS